jgi:hypothetical protein
VKESNEEALPRGSREGDTETNAPKAESVETEEGDRWDLLALLLAQPGTRIGFGECLREPDGWGNRGFEVDRADEWEATFPKS